MLRHCAPVCLGSVFVRFWLTQELWPEVGHYLAQLRHVAKVGGIDSVAIANDFPMGGQENLLLLNNDNRAGVKKYLDRW